MRQAFRAKSPQGGAIDYDVLLEEWLEKGRQEYQDFVVDGNDVVTNTHVDSYSADVSLDPESPSARYKVRLMGEIMRQIRDRVAAADAALSVVVIPHPLDVCDEYDGVRVDTTKYPAYRRDNLTRPLVETMRALGVDCVDLFTEFRAIDATTLFFHGGDDHWNAAGQRRAAAVVAAQLIDENLLRERNR
jgi:hypothetical protein